MVVISGIIIARGATFGRNDANETGLNIGGDV